MTKSKKLDQTAQELVDDINDILSEFSTDGEGWRITGDQQVYIGEDEDGGLSLTVSEDLYDDEKPFRRFRLRLEEVEEER